jgi:hypothetical protein
MCRNRMSKLKDVFLGSVQVEKVQLTYVLMSRYEGMGILRLLPE